MKDEDTEGGGRAFFEAPAGLKLGFITGLYIIQCLFG